MDTIGCLVAMFIMACVAAFFVVVGIWMLIGTIILISKLIVWMAYVGAAVLFLGAIAWVIAKAVSAIRG